MKLDKEYAGLFELVAWLKHFKEQQEAQQVYQPELTLVPDRVPTGPKYRQQTEVKNFKKQYTALEEQAIVSLKAQGWTNAQIGELLGRSAQGIKDRLKIIKRGN